MTHVQGNKKSSVINDLQSSSDTTYSSHKIDELFTPTTEQEAAMNSGANSDDIQKLRALRTRVQQETIDNAQNTAIEHKLDIAPFGAPHAVNGDQFVELVGANEQFLANFSKPVEVTPVSETVVQLEAGTLSTAHAGRYWHEHNGARVVWNLTGGSDIQYGVAEHGIIYKFVLDKIAETITITKEDTLFRLSDGKQLDFDPSTQDIDEFIDNELRGVYFREAVQININGNLTQNARFDGFIGDLEIHMNGNRASHIEIAHDGNFHFDGTFDYIFIDNSVNAANFNLPMNSMNGTLEIASGTYYFGSDAKIETFWGNPNATVILDQGFSIGGCEGMANVVIYPGWTGTVDEWNRWIVKEDQRNFAPLETFKRRELDPNPIQLQSIELNTPDPNGVVLRFPVNELRNSNFAKFVVRNLHMTDVNDREYIFDFETDVLVINSTIGETTRVLIAEDFVNGGFYLLHTTATARDDWFGLFIRVVDLAQGTIPDLKETPDVNGAVAFAL